MKIGLAQEEEQARGDAHIGGLEPHVAIEVRAIAVALAARGVRQRADREPIGVGEQRDTVVERQALAGFDLFAKLSQATIRCSHWTLFEKTPRFPRLPAILEINRRIPSLTTRKHRRASTEGV